MTVKIKYSDFKVVTRSRTFLTPFDSTDTLYEYAYEVFNANWSKRPLRLLGVTVSGFDGVEQTSLFSEAGAPQGRMDEVVDTLRGRFGFESIERGSLLGRKNKKL